MKVCVGGPKDKSIIESSLLNLTIFENTEAPFVKYASGLDAEPLDVTEHFYHLEVIGLEDSQIFFYRYQDVSLEKAIRMLFDSYADSSPAASE